VLVKTIHGQPTYGMVPHTYRQKPVKVATSSFIPQTGSYRVTWSLDVVTCTGQQWGIEFGKTNDLSQSFYPAGSGNLPPSPLAGTTAVVLSSGEWFEQTIEVNPDCRWSVAVEHLNQP
jgi:hypothetical protein